MGKRDPKTLAELRKENRYTLKQVAEGSGVPFGSYVGYDYGTRRLTLESAQKVARFYGISTDDIKEGK